MTDEFSTKAVLDLEIEQSTLRDARSTIQDELGDVTVDVNASPSGRLASSASGGSGRNRSRKLLSDQATSTASIADDADDLVDLAYERNELLEELVDEAESDDQLRARPGSGGAMLAGGAILGVSALSGVLDEFSWPELPEWSWPEIPKPDWLPIVVEMPGDGGSGQRDLAPDGTPSPNPVAPGHRDKRGNPFERGPSTPDTPAAPSRRGIPDPRRGPHPIWNPGRGTPSPSPTPAPNPGVGVFGPDITSDPDGSPGGGGSLFTPENVIKGIGGGALLGAGAKATKGAATSTGPAAGGAGIGFPLPSAIIANTQARAQEESDDDDDDGAWWNPFDDGGGSGGGGRPPTANMRGSNRRTRENRAQQASDRRQSPTINVENSFEIDARTITDLEREMTRELESVKRELERVKRSGGY